MKNDSFLKRYLSKLVNNFGGAIINVLVTLIVPRTLGPAQYGNFNYLRDSFQVVVSLLDLNFGNAHFNYSAKSGNANNATTFYFYFTFLVGIVLFLGVTITHWIGLSKYFGLINN